jgi:hypothetical protein
MIRPFRYETERFGGKYSKPGESVYDHRFCGFSAHRAGSRARRGASTRSLACASFRESALRHGQVDHVSLLAIPAQQDRLQKASGHVST